MKKLLAWITLGLLGVLTIFDALILYLGQFGFDFTQGGSEPKGLQIGWFALVCKVVGFAMFRKTGLLMVVGGLIDWIYAIILQMHGQHHPLGTALSNCPLDGVYVFLAGIYSIVNQRWRLIASKS